MSFLNGKMEIIILSVNGYVPFASDEIFDCQTGELISSPLYSSFHTFYVDTKSEAITVQKLQLEILRIEKLKLDAIPSPEKISNLLLFS